MTNYLYNSRGQPVGFWRGRYIYTLRGKPVGQIRGTHVHKLSGQYVGVLHRDMVVKRNICNQANIGRCRNPGNPDSLSNPGNRGAVSYGFADVFHRLTK